MMRGMYARYHRGIGMDNFIIHALLAGFGIVLATGPLGCFIVWRQMAFFGDTVAHAALLGVALGLLFDVDVTLGVILVTGALTFLLVALGKQNLIATDTLLGILAHAMLAFGLIAAAMLSGVRVDLMGYLFGDILAITRTDLYWIYGITVLVLTVTAVFWKRFLIAAVHEDLAVAEGVAVGRLKIILMLLIALTIAVAMKIVGILLITAMLVIPAASARLVARSPEQMAGLAILAGLAGFLGGFEGAFVLDLPAGPAIVATLSLIFITGFAAMSFIQGYKNT